MKPLSGFISGKCAFYCSAECQKKDWKIGGHKADCPQHQEKCQALGRQTVADMADESKAPLLRVQKLERLDGEGAYRVAVDHGLHDVILKMLKNDAETALVRFQTERPLERVSYAHFIMMTLWRGEEMLTYYTVLRMLLLIIITQKSLVFAPTLPFLTQVNATPGLEAPHSVSAMGGE